MPATKPHVQLTGKDGNAFSILGSCSKAAKKAGWTKDEIDSFMSEAMLGDYDHLLATACEYFDVA
jgi:hypothetical protein